MLLNNWLARKPLHSATFTSSFCLLLTANAWFFVLFLFTKVTDDTVASATTLESTQCAIQCFVFTNFDCCHVLFRPLPCTKVKFCSTEHLYII